MERGYRRKEETRARTRLFGCLWARTRIKMYRNSVKLFDLQYGCVNVLDELRYSIRRVVEEC